MGNRETLTSKRLRQKAQPGQGRPECSPGAVRTWAWIRLVRSQPVEHPAHPGLQIEPGQSVHPPPHAPFAFY